MSFFAKGFFPKRAVRERRPLVIGSITSGIAADAAAVKRAGLPWRHAFFAEIAKFPCAVLKRHYPEVPNLGDITQPIDDTVRAAGIDVFMGSTPCQSYSIAGLRGGMADPRGQLAYRFAELVSASRARWLCYENVPGILTADRGEAFQCLIDSLVERGYGVAWRCYDAQFFGLAQRRKRVFLVGYLGDWRPAAAVLFESASVRGDPAESGTSGPGAARGTGGGAEGGGIAGPLLARGSAGRGHRVDAEGAANGHLVHALAVQEDNQNGVLLSDTAGTLRANAPGTTAVGTLALIPPREVAHTLVAQSVALRGRDGGGTAELGGDKSNALRGANGGGSREHVLAHALNAKSTGRYDPTVETMVVGTLGTQERVPKFDTMVYGIRSDAQREGVARTPSPDAEGRVRLRDPGLGITEGLSPTLDASAAHAVVIPIQEPLSGLTGQRGLGIGADGDPSGTLNANNPQGVAVVIPFETDQITSPENRSRCEPGSPAPTLVRRSSPPAIAFGFYQTEGSQSSGNNEEIAPTLKGPGGNLNAVAVRAFNLFPGKPPKAEVRARETEISDCLSATAGAAMTDRGTRIVQSGVRRLTPTECERLMGVPDGYTALPGAADGPRYAALGNSIAVPVLSWIFHRIDLVDRILRP